MATKNITQSDTAHRPAGRARRLVGPAAALALAAPLLCWAAPAGADPAQQPKDTHCPNAALLKAPTDYPEPYQSFMASLDANNNGLVCVHQFNQAAANALDPKFGLPVGSPLYLVSDDSIVPR